jgi:hypothetical protein
MAAAIGSDISVSTRGPESFVLSGSLYDAQKTSALAATFDVPDSELVVEVEPPAPQPTTEIVKRSNIVYLTYRFIDLDALRIKNIRK